MDWLNRCHFGDVRAVLREMIAAGVKVQCIVTSPPYWGLRDYGHPGQIGLEATPREYVATMVEVFGLCLEILADDGTLWLNLGDSYNAHPGQRKGTDKAGEKQHSVRGSLAAPSRHVSTLKAKDLVGIPWMTAFALRDAGWYLRQGIVWSKPNPMPESVVDRCTKAHEDIFLLSKSPRYYFDQGAISEPLAESSVGRLAQDLEGQAGSDRVPGKINGPMKAVMKRSGNKARKNGTERGCPEGTGSNVCGCVPWEGSRRNKRSVWTVSTKPYKGAHFATFPPELIEPCILAGAPAGGIVLDPFFGSGTTGQVAQRLGRNFIGIDLNRDNEPLQAERLCQPSLDLEAA